MKDQPIDPDLYEARVIISLRAPTNLRVPEKQGSQTGSTPGNTAPSKPTGTVKYFKPDGSPYVNPDGSQSLRVDKNKKLKFSLRGPSEGDQLAGDLVLIAQYSAPNSSTDTKHPRKSPFNDGQHLAVYLDSGKPADWTVNLNRNDAPDDSYFEYCVVALLNEHTVAVNVDPSIIINP